MGRAGYTSFERTKVHRNRSPLVMDLQPAAIFERFAEAREEQGEEGDSSAAVFAGSALEDVPETRRRLLPLMFLRGARHGFRGVVEDLRVEFGEDLAAVNRLRMPAMPSGCRRNAASVVMIVSFEAIMPCRMSSRPWSYAASRTS